MHSTALYCLALIPSVCVTYSYIAMYIQLQYTTASAMATIVSSSYTYTHTR